MDYTAIKWILFVTLLLTVPAVLFLVQAVFFIPAIFFLAGMIGSVAKRKGEKGSRVISRRVAERGGARGWPSYLEIDC